MKIICFPKSCDIEKRLSKWRAKARGTREYGICFISEELWVNGLPFWAVPVCFLREIHCDIVYKLWSFHFTCSDNIPILIQIILDLEQYFDTDRNPYLPPYPQIFSFINQSKTIGWDNQLRYMTQILSSPSDNRKTSQEIILFSVSATIYNFTQLK